MIPLMARRWRYLSIAMLLIVTYSESSAVSEVPAPNSKADEAESTTYRNLNDISLLIERDAIREINGDRFRSIYKVAEELAPRYESQASNGDREAQFKLGAMYLEGVGVRPNSGVALRWFIKAGGAEHPLALVAQGRFDLKCKADNSQYTSELERTIEALGLIGPSASNAVPILSNYLRYSWPLNRKAAVALARVGDRGLPVLLAGLKDQDTEVRRAAAEAFSEVESAAVSAKDQLTAALEDDDPVIRESAKRALAWPKVREKSK